MLKHLPKSSGIYQIKCRSNNKIYIGSAVDIRHRCEHHRRSLRRGKNLFDFCRQNNLDFSSMHRLAKGKGKLKSYKGWSHVNSIRQRDYVKTYDGFIDPNGARVGPITNLAAFCRENNLDDTHMVAVAHGRLYSHRGWTFDNDRRNMGFKTYRGFINPQGDRVIISNSQGFCRDNNLSISTSRNNLEEPENRGAGYVRTPIFGKSFG